MPVNADHGVLLCLGNGRRSAVSLVGFGEYLRRKYKTPRRPKYANIARLQLVGRVRR